MERIEDSKINKESVLQNCITYKTDFICTYQKIDDSDDSNDSNDSTILYQIQFLQAFDLLEFNDNIINKITESLYERYKDSNAILLNPN